MTSAIFVLVGLVLLLAGSLKLLRPGPAVAALLDLPDLLGARALGSNRGVRALGTLELAVAAGALAGWRPAEVAAATLLSAFAAWLVIALAHGRSGASCPCFAARTKVSPTSAALCGLLAALAIVGCVGHAPRVGLAGWLALACGLLLLLCLAGGALMFVLAREVAALRRQVAVPRVALEIADEGPPLGEESPLIERFSIAEDTLRSQDTLAQDAERSPDTLALAVFVSPGCEICGELEPAIASVGSQPSIELRIFDEATDQLTWLAGAIPGSPYAVAMTPDGTVLAKGTFNTLEQLQSVPATARLRATRGLAHA